MLYSDKKNMCGQVRQRLAESIASRIAAQPDWIARHITDCPKCRRRLSGFNRVSLALWLMKSRPHRLDLLSRANSQAIGVLGRSLRSLPKADRLRAARPAPKPAERCARYTSAVANAAACAAMLLLMRLGVFSSMVKFQDAGEQAVKQYYAQHLGEDMADDVFRA